MGFKFSLCAPYTYTHARTRIGQGRDRARNIRASLDNDDDADGRNPKIREWPLPYTRARARLATVEFSILLVACASNKRIPFSRARATFYSGCAYTHTGAPELIPRSLASGLQANFVELKLVRGEWVCM